MSKSTRATLALTKAGAAFTVHTYDYDPTADRIGMAAAEALGEEPCRVPKTLMAELDGKPVCVVVPSDREVSMKKLAEAERLTGYHVGGISPFGQKKQVPTAIEEAAMAETLVYINGGQRGLQVRLSPQDAVKALKAIVASLVA